MENSIRKYTNFRYRWIYLNIADGALRWDVALWILKNICDKYFRTGCADVMVLNALNPVMSEREVVSASNALFL
jgi:hypothetical protein